MSKVVPCSEPVSLALECSALKTFLKNTAQSWELEVPGSVAVSQGSRQMVVAVTVKSV